MTVNANAAWRLLEGRTRGSWMGAINPLLWVKALLINACLTAGINRTGERTGINISFIPVRFGALLMRWHHHRLDTTLE
ncbi:hypothetical protein [Delftia acidovorans]|uniref:hypothetical protein n=1 Tax=Delftia acidovorans TaxID=80866 RepID=UPI001EE1015C|nr:hypothetical protein [Delftia acidovorans]MCG3783175.1 hypothetical protein [Delftia acidovorans]